MFAEHTAKRVQWLPGPHPAHWPPPPADPHQPFTQTVDVSLLVPGGGPSGEGGPSSSPQAGTVEVHVDGGQGEEGQQPPPFEQSTGWRVGMCVIDWVVCGG